MVGWWLRVYGSWTVARESRNARPGGWTDQLGRLSQQCPLVAPSEGAGEHCRIRLKIKPELLFPNLVSSGWARGRSLLPPVRLGGHFQETHGL